MKTCVTLTADWHLRSTRPKSRTDDFLSSQEKKVRFILQLAQEHNCPIVIAGDLFETPRPGEFIKQWIINIFREYNVKIFCTCGQHDLPGHNLSLIPDSGIGVLEAANVITLLTDPNRPVIYGNYIFYGCPFGKEPYDVKIKPSIQGHKSILIWHHMVINDPLWWSQEADKAGKILRLLNKFDLIVTGDNHSSFIYDRKDKWLVNPGSLFRKTAAQLEHRPSVYIYDNREVERVYIPIEEDVFDISHISNSKEKLVRYTDFTDKLHAGYEISTDINKSFISYFEHNNTRKSVEDLVWECIPD